jgi:LPS sulfotransferase NodH
MPSQSPKNTLRKIKSLITLEDPASKRLALEVGLLKGHTNFTRFIILGRSRTGSNFLRGLINSSPAVLSLGEIFRDPQAIDFDHPEFQASPEVLDLYQRDPVQFLEQVVYRKEPLSIATVGFKLFYYHARTAPFDALWDYWQRHEEIRIVHIKRRNILHTHLSRENAQKSGQWVNTTGEKEDHGPVSLDYEDCLQDFVRTRQWEREADGFFRDHPLLQVTYEELSSDPGSESVRIQKFLGLEPAPVQAHTYKQLRKPLSQAIRNYAELKERFAGSEWAEFFED